MNSSSSTITPGSAQAESSAPTKNDVRAALAELRINRPRHLADRTIRHILHRYGDGATNINDLKQEYYGAVYAAAGGAISSPTRAGLDLRHMTDGELDAAWNAAIAAHNADAAGQCEVEYQRRHTTRQRPLTPLIVDLENRLAERAGMPRQKPLGRVDLGNAGRAGDQADDAPPPSMPPGERMT